MKSFDEFENRVRELKELTHGKVVSRRAFTAGLAALGLSPLAARMTPVHAKDLDIVLVNWGGEATAAMQKAYVDPFLAKHPDSGVSIDPSGPITGKIKVMVESRKVSWDVIDRGYQTSLELGRQGLLEDVDYSIVDRNKVLPGYANQWGVANYSFGYVLTYDTKAFGGKIPTSWRDFWNLKDFPGGRALHRDVNGTVEPALFADGVPRDKIYPIDVDRAFNKLREIKDSVTFWSVNADGERLMRDRECAMGCLPHTRSLLVRRDTKGEIDFTFNEGVLLVSSWMVPKGNPAGKRAWELVASMQDPQGQVEMLKLLGNGPVNPAANALIPAGLQKDNPFSAENQAKMVAVDVEWYAANYARVFNQLVDTVFS